jgi:hypothetical protein
LNRLQDRSTTHAVRTFVPVIACLSLVLATVLPAGADPGKITKYVFPDGTVVYSDKPVPGATAVGEIVVPPAPTPPTAKAPATEPSPNAGGTATPPPAPDDEAPLIAEAREGRCHLRVTSGWQWIEIRIEGLVRREQRHRQEQSLRAIDVVPLAIIIRYSLTPLRQEQRVQRRVHLVHQVHGQP